MHLRNHSESSLPKIFPVGATYVVEGRGGETGDLRVFSRYVVLPDGQRINLPADSSTAPMAVSARRIKRGRSAATGRAKAPSASAKKIAARAGTAKRHRR